MKKYPVPFMVPSIGAALVVAWRVGAARRGPAVAERPAPRCFAPRRSTGSPRAATIRSTSMSASTASIA